MKELFTYLDDNYEVRVPIRIKIILGLPLPNKKLRTYKLNLSYSNDIELPENLTIYDDLNLYKSRIKKLPKGLNVNTLSMIDSDVQYLPDDIQVNTIIASYSKLKMLPNNLNLNGSLILNGNGNMRELPKGLKIHGELDIRFTNINYLPDDLIVDGNIRINLLKFDLFKSRFPKFAKQII